MIAQPSPLYAECPACKETVEYIEELSGQATTCPYCGVEILLPAIERQRSIHPTRLHSPARRTWKLLAIFAAVALFVATVIIFWIRLSQDPGTATPLLILITGILGFIGFYFLPTFIAGLRGHRNIVAIAILNTAFGWTLIGWIAALIWSVYRERKLP